MVVQRREAWTEPGLQATRRHHFRPARARNAAGTSTPSRTNNEGNLMV